MNSIYAVLEQRFEEKNKLEQIIALIDWDAHLFCPENASDGRGEQKAMLELKIHQILTNKDWNEIFDKLENASDLDEWQKTNVRQAKIEQNNAALLPEEIVEQMVLASNAGVNAWFKARENNDFKSFQPFLERLVDLQRQVGKIKNKDNVYDALLDNYETGITQSFIDPLFSDLKSFLPDFIQEVQAKQGKKPEPFANYYPIRKQKEFCKSLMSQMGFDFKRGRVDVSQTAFCTTCGKDDIRVISHFDENDPFKGIGAIMHETGHALYEQHLPYKYMNQPVGQQRGMAMHESQSLLMEGAVMQSREFLKYLAEQMFDFYASEEVAYENLKSKMLYVQPSLIRIDADEVTYPLHVILRYELEKELISGNLAVKDLPTAWNDKMRAYLGVVPPDDSKGCLQDIHWADGNFGYFPDYTLGVLAAAQFYATAVSQVQTIEQSLAEGCFKPLVQWLSSQIYSQASFNTFEQTVLKVTGQKLTTDAFKKALIQKYL